MTREADKAFEELPNKERPRVLEVLRQLVVEPFVGSNIKKLHGPYENRYRCRQGDYRIVYEVLKEEHKVRVLYILQRAEAYKKR